VSGAPELSLTEVKRELPVTLESHVTGTTTQTADTFERLLDAMPRIAEAVNAFTSEDNQRSALAALVEALGVAPREAQAVHTPPVESPDGGNDREEITQVVEDDAGETEPEAANGKGKPSARRRRTTKKPEPIRDIDFRPEGKQSFKEFVEEKGPKSMDQKNLTAVFWLEQIAEVHDIGAGHVTAAYKDRNWREPANPANALQATASREHWVDTKNMKAIVTTPSGRNQVKFEMPSEAAR
jgi:hypothetical protein